MKKIILLIISILLFFIISEPTLAQSEAPLSESGCLYQLSPTGVTDIVTIKCVIPLFTNAVYWMIVFSGVVATFLIIYGGIRFLTSSGDPGKVEGARKTLIFAILGLVTIISSFMILNIVADLTGVNCISEFGFQSCKSENPIDDYRVRCNNECRTPEKCIPVGDRYVDGKLEEANAWACYPPCGSGNGYEIGYCNNNAKVCIKGDGGKYSCQNP